jgi:CheY-like chemotaxis protein
MPPPARPADFSDCRSLIVDGNATSRSTLAAMLRDLGVGHVVQCSRLADGRRALENGTFDIVLCDYHFEHSSSTGQDLLDDLRRANLLPYATVFVMITGEASYAKVAEAAEGALDGYLLKPHTASSLEQRLVQARHRKHVLRHVFEAIEAEDFARAAALCVQRFEAKAEFWLFSARIGAELLLRLGMHEPARKLYDAVRATRAAPWARLGIARADLDAGKTKEAVATLTALMTEDPGYADAYDVMGRAQVEQGDLQAALATFRQAVAITPHSIARLQKQGMLAFHLGDAAEARRALSAAARIGLASKSFDPQSLVMLAFGHFDERDGKELGRDRDMLIQLGERRADDTRVQRFAEIAQVLVAMHARQVAEVVHRLKMLAAQVDHADFDFEAGINLLALLARLRATELQLDPIDAWVREVARRFCTSKASAELLRLALRGDAAGEAIVAEVHVDIGRVAEEAMSHTLAGAPGEAVLTLIAHGRETRNAKLIDLAGAVLTRHAAKITDGTPMQEAVAALRSRWCTRAAQVVVGAGTGRAAGSLALR